MPGQENKASNAQLSQQLEALRAQHAILEQANEMLTHQVRVKESSFADAKVRRSIRVTSRLHVCACLPQAAEAEQSATVDKQTQRVAALEAQLKVSVVLVSTVLVRAVIHAVAVFGVGAGRRRSRRRPRRSSS